MNNKKVLTIIIGLTLLALVLGIFGCSSPQTTPTTTAPTTTAPTISPTSTVKPTTTTTAPPTTTASTQSFKLVVSTWAATNMSQGTQIMEPLAKLLQERSNGRLTLDIHYSASLVGAVNEPEALNKGVIDLLPHWLSQYNISTDPVFGIGKLPFAFKTQDQFNAAWAAGIKDIFVKRMAAKYPNTMLIDNTNTYPSVYVGLTYKGTTAPILPPDLRGKKIRVADAFEKNMMDAAGGSGIFVPMNEAYLTLQRGIADAAISYPDGVYTNKFYEVTDGFVIHFMSVPLGVATVNKQKFNSMPADLQKILTSTMQEVAASYDKYELTWEQSLMKEGIPNVAKPGWKIYSISDAEYATWTDYAKSTTWKYFTDLAGVDGDQILRIIQAVRQQ